METTRRFNGRIGMTAVRLAAVLALALMMAGMFAHRASAEPVQPTGQAYKDAFKQGCESGGGSYIENLDGSFQCNLRDGGVIKCPDTTHQCTYTPKRIQIGGTIRVTSANAAKMVQLPSLTPTPEPTWPAVKAGAVGIVQGSIASSAP